MFQKVRFAAVLFVLFVLFVLVIGAKAEEAKDPRYQPITQAELRQKLLTTPIESPEQERLIVRADNSGLCRFAYDQYTAIWRRKQDNPFANLYLGMVALGCFAASDTPTITPEQAGWLKVAGNCLLAAFTLDAKNPDIQIEYGFFCLHYSTERVKGIQLIKSAITTRPNDARAHRLLGSIYSVPLQPTFNATEAEKELRTAIRLDPLYAGPHGDLYHFYYNVKRYEEAEKEVLISKSLIPKHVAESKGMTSYEDMILQAIAKKP